MKKPIINKKIIITLSVIFLSALSFLVSGCGNNDKKDVSAPEITIDETPIAVAAGQEINLSLIKFTARDEVDGNIVSARYSAQLDGRDIEVKGGKITPETSGTLKITLAVEDKSGNSASKDIETQVFLLSGDISYKAAFESGAESAFGACAEKTFSSGGEMVLPDCLLNSAAYEKAQLFIFSDKDITMNSCVAIKSGWQVVTFGDVVSELGIVEKNQAVRLVFSGQGSFTVKVKQLNFLDKATVCEFNVTEYEEIENGAEYFILPRYALLSNGVKLYAEYSVALNGIEVNHNGYFIAESGDYTITYTISEDFLSADIIKIAVVRVR